MHVAKQLAEKHLRIKIGALDASLDDLFPNANKHDRFGLVVNETLGSLGASLLLQAAIVQFYRVAPRRRDSARVYPEIYLFHVGGQYGDHSMFDFWPPRKEVFVTGGSPLAVLEAINERAITRLALPDGKGGDVSLLAEGPSVWAEQAAAKDLLTSCFAYSPLGETSDADVWLHSSHRSFEENVTNTLNIKAVISSVADDPQELSDSPETADMDRWVVRAEARLHEFNFELAREIGGRRLRGLGSTCVRGESFRQIDTEEAMSLLTCL